MDTIFKALSDKSRRQILDILRDKDMTVGEIARHFAFTGPTLSHHLDILKRARLVVCQKKGQYVWYSLNTSVIEQITKMLISFFNKEV